MRKPPPLREQFVLEEGRNVSCLVERKTPVSPEQSKQTLLKGRGMVRNCRYVVNANLASDGDDDDDDDHR